MNKSPTGTRLPVQGRDPTYNGDLWGTETTKAGSWSWTFPSDEGFGYGAVGSLQDLGEVVELFIQTQSV